MVRHLVPRIIVWALVVLIVMSVFEVAAIYLDPRLGDACFQDRCAR